MTKKIFIYLVPLVSVLIFAFQQRAKKKIIYFGDSITYFGVRPEGYISKLDSIIHHNKLINQYELLGAGVKGNKIYDLYLRMDDDVIAKHPDAVVIWIGINNIWHKQLYGTGTDADKFDKFYNAIIKKLMDNNITVFICTPTVIGEETGFTNQDDGDLNKYSAIIRGVAKQNECGIIDFRKSFLDYLATHNPNDVEDGILTKADDGVHLNDTGNIFAAQELYKVLSKSFIY